MKLFLVKAKQWFLNQLVKVKQWFLNQKASFYFQFVAGVLILVAFIVQLAQPEQFNTLVVFVFLSYLSYIVYNILDKKE
jgi:hypothetical protein